MLLRIAAIIFLFSQAAPAAENPLDLPAPFRGALHELRNGHFRVAIENARALQENYPGHPLAPLLSAEATWKLIFCETGHINSHEIWNEATEKTSSMDEDFFGATETALKYSKAWRQSQETDALGEFYDGLTHGVRARLYTLRAQAMKSASEGKQMRSALLNAAAKDPRLENDSEAGLGVYNYYADVLSPLVKFFRMFLMIPGGDREKGLAQLRRASQKASILNTESAHELANILAVRESRWDPLESTCRHASLSIL